MLEFQEWMDKLIATQNLVSLIRYLPKIGLAILIPILDKLYNSVAVWLNNKENYRTEESFENQLIIKKTLFQFVNSFFALFYTAFYLQDVDKLKELLAALLITRQVVGNLKESLLPYASKQLKLAKMSFDLFGALSPTSPEEKSVGEHRKTDSSTGVQEYRKTDRSTGVQEYRKTDRVSSSNPLQEDWKEKEGEERRPTNKVQGARLVSQVEIEGSTLQYEGTFDDYLEMFIQFGYVTLFSSAYPLAGLCALLNNLIEIRSDAFKLCFIHQRPFAQRVSNIGSWQTAMEVMGDIGVVVNCGLIGLLGPVHRIFPDITPAQQVFLIVLLEHLMLLLKLLVTAAIPDTPCWLTEEIAKIEHKKKTVERNYFNRSMSLGSMDVEDKVTQHETCSCKEKTEEFTLNLQVNEITEPKEDEEWEGPLQGIEESTFRNHRYTQQYNTGSTLGSLSISSVNENPTVFQDGNRQDQSSQVKEIDLIKTRSFSLCSGEKATVTRSENLPRDALGRDISATYGEHKPDLGNIIVNNVPTPAFHASYQLKSCATPPHKRVLEQKEFDKKLKAKGAFFLKGRSLSLASFKLPARFKLDRAEKIPMKRKLSKERRNCEEDRSYGDQEVVRGELELLNIEELINIQDLDVQINQRLRKS